MSQTTARPAPLFSVVVTLYNAQQFLEETLLSVQAQTWRDFEVVMVDDGSTDDTAEIALRFVRADARFHLIRSTNRGISRARNTAVAHSSGTWIAVCDGDDVWLPDKLAVQAAFIAAWNQRGGAPLAALGSAGTFINAAGQPYGSIDPPERPWADGSLDMAASPDVTVINSSVVFPRDLFLQVGGYRPDYTPTEDLDLCLRLREVGVVANVPQHLTLYRMHGQNFSHTSYVPMLLNAQRCYANARRRALGLPEWTEAEFLADLRRDRPAYVRTMRALRHMMYYNMGKVNLHNRQPLLALGGLAMSVLIAPEQSVRLLARSRVLRRTLARTAGRSE